MAEYIEKGALMNHIESEARIWGDDYDAYQILGDIEDCPPADVRPVVRGRWIHFYLDSDRYIEVKCSVCRKHFTVDIVRSCGIGVAEGDLRYCPNCGADMREEESRDGG